MKIRLTDDLSVDKKFGMTKGTVWEATINRRAMNRGSVHWWITVQGEKIGVLWHEAEIVKENK